MSKLSDDVPCAEQLREAGFTTVLRVQNASDEELLAVPGIGQLTLEKIRAATAGVATDEPAAQTVAAFECPNPACGHTITASPCPYCGQ